MHDTSTAKVWGVTGFTSTPPTSFIARMGGSSSRELEAAQAQVKRLSTELQRATQKMMTNGSGLAAAAKAEQQLRADLQAKSQQLEAASGELNQLRNITNDLPKIKNDAAAAKEELRKIREAHRDKDAVVGDLKEALRLSKAELEELFGKLKFAEQQNVSAARRAAQLSEEKSLLLEQQNVAATTSARLVAEASSQLNAAEHATGKQGVHPIFGELLVDLGYKRLYRGSPSTLWAGTLLWERQRAFRADRAALIASAKAKSSERGWPGAIAVVESSDGSGDPASNVTGSTIDGNAGVRLTEQPLGMLIDGQHRLGAAHLLAKRGKLHGALSTILVEVYPPMMEDEIKDLFVEINRAEPVLLIDLPDASGASQKDNAILTDAAEKLSTRYPAMFKPSQSCRPPHLNIDVLRAEMHRSQLLSRHQLATSDQLLDWLETTNAELAGRSDAVWAVDSPVKSEAALSKAIAKAREHELFLGLGWGWLNQ